jgi:hypothetical protein
MDCNYLSTHLYLKEDRYLRWTWRETLSCSALDPVSWKLGLTLECTCLPIGFGLISLR